MKLEDNIVNIYYFSLICGILTLIVIISGGILKKNGIIDSLDNVYLAGYILGTITILSFIIGIILDWYYYPLDSLIYSIIKYIF